MTPEQKIGLYANINRIKAQDTIHRGDYDQTDFRGIYSLYMTAFGNEALANRMRTKAAERLVDSKTEAAAAGR